MEDFLQLIEQVKSSDGFSVETVDSIYKCSLRCANEGEGQQVSEILQDTAEFVDIKNAVFFHSIAIYICKTNSVFKRMLKYIIKHIEEFEDSTKCFLYGQTKAYSFSNPSLVDYEIKTMLYDILKITVDCYRYRLADKIKRISYNERTKGLVLVFIDCYLRQDNSDRIAHAPTKTANDRCKVLIEKLGKKVLLINTAESYSLVGGITYANLMKANYAEWCSQENSMFWKGCRIPYFQCDYNMPDIDTMGAIFDLIYKIKPEYAITIGGGIITGNLVSDIIPVLSVGTVPSEITGTMAHYQTFSGTVDDEGEQLLKHMNKNIDSIIECTFTYSLVEKKGALSRHEVGLSEKSFVISVMGARLDTDISDEFMQIMDAVCDDRTEFLMLGSFRGNNSFFEKNIEKYPRLKSKTHYVGMVDDPLAYLELCDINLNPPRTGGGGSGVESLYVGKPVVTMNFGDVASVCGDKYCVASVDEMIGTINRYKTDCDYYDSQKKYAKKRAEELLDSSREFSRVIKEFENKIVERGI